MKRKTYYLFAAVAVLMIAVASAFATGIFGPETLTGLVSVITGGGIVGGLGLVGAPGMPQAGGQPQLLPFRQNTRQKFASAGSDLTYGTGSSLSMTLPKVGYLSKIYIRFNGSITATSAGADTITYAKFGPWSVLRNINFNMNSGKQTLIDASGYEMFLHQSTRKKSGRTDQQTDSDFYAAPATGSAQAMRLTWEIPIAVSDGQNFAVGLVNLQAPELQATLNLTCAAALADIGSNISTLTGTFNVAYEYYEVPDPSRVSQPAIVVHKIISQATAVASTGDNRVEIPRGGTLLRVLQILECNGAKSDAYDSVEIILNKTQSMAKLDRWNAKFRNRQQYGYVLPTGVFCWDFQNAWDQCEESDLRDALDTERVTTTEFVTRVTAGTTLGTNNNFIYSVREFLQIPVA